MIDKLIFIYYSHDGARLIQWDSFNILLLQIKKILLRNLKKYSTRKQEMNGRIDFNSKKKKKNTN